MSNNVIFIRSNFLLAISCGALLAFSWPPSQFGFLLFFSLVPLLLFEENIIRENKLKRTFFFYAFLAILIWHTVSLQWFLSMSVKNACIVSVVDSILIASFLMIPHLLKRRGFKKIGHLAFICFWISLELIHANWELSFPLMCLGNGLGMFPYLIQWYEWTGVMGGSFWILVINILIFQFLKKFQKQNSFNINFDIIRLSLTLLIPIVISLFRFFTYEEIGKSIEIVSIHPNINCYQEKYQWSQEQLVSRYISCTKEQISQNTEYVIWPENALTNTEWLSNINNFKSFQAIKDSLRNFTSLKLITGGISYDLYQNKKNTKLPTVVTHSPKLNQFYYTYNAAFQLEQGQKNIPMRSKKQLVPFEESIPYPEWLGFLRKISGSFGGFIFSTSKSNDNVFSDKNGQKVTPLICYESAFGATTASYVKNGAQILFVLLNEGWYKHLQGAAQFLNLSRIRAIETRRSVARSSNDGISAFINQRGEILKQVGEYKPQAIKHNLKLNSRITFYVRYRDYLAKGCAFFAFLITLYFTLLLFNRKP